MIADIGCGNGKYLDQKETGIIIGSDMSMNLLRICARKGFPGIAADALVLPYRSNVFDGAISIAVIHHFASESRRIRAIKEMIRIVKPGGRILVYVWAFEQTGRFKDKFPDQDAFIPWSLQKRFSSTETKSDVLLSRYYHLFKEGELIQIFKSIPGIEALDSGFDQENWWVIARKH